MKQPLPDLQKYFLINISKNCRNMSTVAKSYEHKDSIIDYCSKVRLLVIMQQLNLELQLSLKESDVEKKLQQATIKNRKDFIMLGALEVLQLGKNLIQLINGKRCLDIGTYTSASALAWAIATPENGQIFTFDVDHKALDEIGRSFLKEQPKLEKKIIFKLGKAVENLDEMIASGQEGKWDFAFIDADKENYTTYYNRCMKLLRSGGIVMVDNVII